MQNIIESYNVDEAFMYEKTYLFIKGFAVGRHLNNTLKMLPIARKIHNGQYRKGFVTINGEKRQLPYVLHVLKVCSTLISLDLPMSDYELDILLTVALGHDLIEDGNFPNDGAELMNVYGFSEEIYKIIKLLSKRPGASEEELNIYFNEIKKNKYALLVKMSDRSHNVEDLYNMKVEKLHKYVEETRRWIYPLSSYAKANYPELSNGVTVLKAKIMSLTEATEAIVEMYNEKLDEKQQEIDTLKEQIKSLETQISNR